MPQVSVIVPAYNVEAYIRQCLDSLVNQTLPDIEIIVIDDGSADGTPAIIAEYTAKYASIRSIRQNNQGLSGARNTGVAAAKGDYIGFVDSDDWVNHDMYRLLHQRAVSQQCDLVICNGRRFDHVTGKLEMFWSQDCWHRAIRKAPSAVFRAIDNPAVFLIEPTMPTRLIRRTLLDKIHLKFLPGLIYEDLLAHFEILVAASAVTLVDQAPYYCRVNRPGQITSWRDDRNLQIVTIFEKIDQFLISASPPDDIWAAAIKFQLRYALNTRRHNDAVGNRVVEGWRATLNNVPKAATLFFYKHYPLDRFAMYCIQSGRLDWLDSYIHGNLTNEIRRFLILHPSMWWVILRSFRNKAVAIRRRLFGDYEPRN